VSLETAAKARVLQPLDDERIEREGEIPITLLPNVGPEPWDWVSTRGKMPLGAVGGRVLIGDIRFPDAGLVWSTAADEEGPVVTHIWVAQDLRGHGVGRALLEIYRSMVADPVLISGPFTPGGRALAHAYGARIIHDEGSITRLKRSLLE
jgi:GNAT superfamily N-acetyltransferase